MVKDDCELLGLGPNPTRSEIEKAYRELARTFHPDAHANATQAELRIYAANFRRLTEAREALVADLDGQVYRRAAPAPPPASTSQRPTAPPPISGCEVCGSTPAGPVRFKQQTAMLVTARVATIESRLCRDCGLSIGRKMQNRTLVTGWWGLLSFLRNLAYVASNARLLRAIGKIDSPTRSGAASPSSPAPLSPGRSVFLRPGALVVVALVITCAIAAAVSEPAATWSVGECVATMPGDSSRVHPVHCTEPHHGEIVEVAESVSDCPASAERNVQMGGAVFCIDTT